MVSSGTEASMSAIRLARLKFRRQHPIGPFVVDFYCHDVRLVVEVDGMSHDGRGPEDRRRTAFLEGRAGLRVLRVSNDDVLRDPEAVAMAILRAAGREWPSPPGPSP